LDQIPIAQLSRLIIANRATERTFVVGETLQATHVKFLTVQNEVSLRFNPLAQELIFLILAHSVYKM